MARRLAGRHGYPEAPHHFDVMLRPDRLGQPCERLASIERDDDESLGDLDRRDRNADVDVPDLG